MYGLKQKGNYESNKILMNEPRVIDNTLQNQMNKYINQLQHNKNI